MSTKLPTTFVIFLALVGLVDASYLTWTKLNGVLPPCELNANCEAVLSSPWSSLGPIPISALGMFFYALVLTLASLILLEVNLAPLIARGANRLKLHPTHSLRFLTLREILTFLASCGFAFSLYLVFLMKFVIDQWCLYCLLSATSSTLIFLLTLVSLSQNSSPSPFVLKNLSFTIQDFCYRYLLRPVFFQLDPEFIHTQMVKVGAQLGRFPLTRQVSASQFAFRHPSLERTLLNIKFANPLGLAAGFDYDGQLTAIMPSLGFGWQTIGTVTLQPYAGNPRPRLGRFPHSQALLVNKGLKSIGAPALIRQLTQTQFRLPTVISIASTNQAYRNERAQLLDILRAFTLFEQSSLSHALYELNISCPNAFGGEPFTTPTKLAGLLSALDKLDLSRPLLIKMPIDLNADQMSALLKVINDHNVQGLNIGNLTKDHNNPGVTPDERVEWGKLPGNLSGKPTWERSNAHIRLARSQFKNRFLIVGTGGIFTGEDAQTKLALGADLIQLVTGLVYGGPQTIGKINHFLARTQITNERLA